MTQLAMSPSERRLAWVSKALCRSADPDELFVRGCAVVAECLADALDNRIEFGVWGGKTERQRRKLIKQHPEVTSWSDHFAGRRTPR
jgi:WhiB family redox-sensing transcriptional regulator